MEDKAVRSTVNLDGYHSLDITVYEERRTVITELVVPDEQPVLIYAERFNEPVDYLKRGIKAGIDYVCFEEKPPILQKKRNGKRRFEETLKKIKEKSSI